MLSGILGTDCTFAWQLRHALKIQELHQHGHQCIEDAYYLINFCTYHPMLNEQIAD